MTVFEHLAPKSSQKISFNYFKISCNYNLLTFLSTTQLATF